MPRRERDGATRFDRAIVRMLPVVPKPLVQRVASGTSPARPYRTRLGSYGR